MIVLKDYNWKINSNYPDTDWTDGKNTLYIVDDNSDLGRKLLSGSPHDFNYIEDENGNLIDVTPIEASLETLKERKISEMSSICHTTITNGVDFNGEHYSLDSEAQTNITNLFMLSGNPMTASMLSYHADDQVCRKYSAEEIQGLYTTMFGFVAYNTTYNNLIKDDVKKMSTSEEVEAVYYGFPLSAENQALFDELMNTDVGA